MTAWLATLPVDEKKTRLNTVKYYDSSTALHLAAEHNQPVIAKLLLDEGAGTLKGILNFYLSICCYCNLIDPNTKKDDDGCSALHVACNNFTDGDITEVVKLLIERYSMHAVLY